LLRLFKSKWFVVSLVTIALLVVIGVSANKSSKLNWLNNILSVPLKPVQSLLSSAGREIENLLGYFQDIDALREENEALKAEVEELRKQNREYSKLKEKNDELRRALDLKAEFGDYTIAGANIIAIEPGNWFSVFKVDIGERDEICMDFPVVTSSGVLVGRVFDTDISTSNIQTIIDEESAVLRKSGAEQYADHITFQFCPEHAEQYFKCFHGGLKIFDNRKILCIPWGAGQNLQYGTKIQRRYKVKGHFSATEALLPAEECPM
jgi:cell shape-determining protein MreC